MIESIARAKQFLILKLVRILFSIRYIVIFVLHDLQFHYRKVLSKSKIG